MDKNEFKLIICTSPRYETLMGSVTEYPVLEKYKYRKTAIGYKIAQNIEKRFSIRIASYNEQLRNNNGTIVVFDAETTPTFLKWLKEHNPNARLIYYYWNAIEENSIMPNQIKEYGYEVWSFDPRDCQKYDLPLNKEFFCFSWYAGINQSERPCSDVCFIGRDKNGRMKEILQLIDEISAVADIQWDTYFTARKWWQRFRDKRYQPHITFDKMLIRQGKARAILDYANEAQSSITLRFFDALCNNRKVITNNKNVVREEIYSKDNIFVLGIDDIKHLKLFLEKPFVPIDERILNRYCIYGWRERFGK